MKKTTLALMAFLFTIFSFSQVNVGTGTTVNEEMPIEPYYKFSYSQVIYTAAEINASGSITGLKYTATPETTLANSNGWEIWLGHTSLSFHPVNESDIPSWVDISELTQVFAGTVSIADQIVEITFDTPFEYNGTDNLIIAVNETSNVNDAYDSSNNDFYCTPTPGTARGLASYNDSAAIDPSNPPTLYAYSVRQSFANVTFEGINQSCPNPDPAVVESIDGVQVSFLFPSNDLSYEFIPSMDPDVELTSSTSGIPLGPNDQIFIDDENGVPVGYYNPSIMVGLQPTTEYVFYLRTVCDGEYSSWVPTYFTTGCTMFELPFSESFEDDSLSWQCWTVEDLTPEGAPANLSWTPIAGYGVDSSFSAYLWTVDNLGKNDDYLITPQLNLSGNDRLKFSVSSFPNTLDVNSMSVLLSTTTANPEDFTTVLSEPTEYPGYFTDVTIDLSAFSGPVYIAFYVPPTATEGYAIYVDGVIVEETPECDAPLNITLDNITSESAEISWNPGASQESQWEYVLQEAGADQPTGSGTLIDTSSILLEGLMQGAEYEFYVRAACDDGSFSSYVPNNGLYFKIPPVGGICADPLVIESFPFNVTDDTANYEDNYNGLPGDAESCGTSSSFLNGDDVFYSYTAPYDMSVTVTFSPVGSYAGIFMYDSCDNVGLSCVAGASSFGIEEHVFEVDLLENQTYIIAISTWAAPQSTPYELTITENSCIQPVISASALACVDDEYYIEVNISDLGSSSLYDFSDNLGNTQSVLSDDTITFGPYSGTDPVTINAVGDDPNCDQSFTVLSACQSCVPLGGNCTAGDGFVGLVIADIDNSNSGCSPDGYGIFPDLTTDLAQGATYPVTVTTGYSNQYVRAWVDFNDDYEYTLDELIIDNALIASVGTTDIEAVIPADANLGVHSMRFKSNWNAAVPDDPCEVTNWSEVEDYTITIVESLSTNDYLLEGLKIYPNPVNGDFVTIKSPIAGDKFINLFDINGRKVLSTTLVGDMLNISSFSPGFYMIEVSVGDSKKVSKLVIE